MTYLITVNNIDYEAEVDYEIKCGELVEMEISDVRRDDVKIDGVELLEVLHELDKQHFKIAQACHDNDSHMFHQPAEAV